MILQHQPPVHLTYCMNIHAGEAWSDQHAALREKVAVLRQMIAPGEWFGVGLRLGAHAVADLVHNPKLRHAALDVFAENHLYPFTVNAFPYGRFHAGPVKENVYAPDWRTDERLAYTFSVCDLLAQWLPEQVDGSISTVPGSFKRWIKTDDDRLKMAQNLAAVAAYLAAIRDDTGREIHLGVEPEPSCFLETTEETIAFFKEVLWTDGVDEIKRIRKCYTSEAEEMIRRHLGVCFDTCHVALQFEDPAASMKAYLDAGIRISKVQLSAALMINAGDAAWDALRPFAEPVYLHQVKGRTAEGAIRSWDDLPPALADEAGRAGISEARVHFHVPLFYEGAGEIKSTAGLLSPDFFAQIRDGATSHVEIETYTFDVLPPDIRPPDITQSIAREYAWAVEHFQRTAE